MIKDMTLVCNECHQEFVWTAGEQEFYEEKGLEKPELCMICRARRRAELRDREQYRKK